MHKRTEKKPWGGFEEFCKNEACTVKIITVMAGEAMSLQHHSHRDEFWRILEGNPKIIVGDSARDGKDGDEFFIPRGVRHRIVATGKNAKILEIAFGSFDEADIVRVEDKYNRK